MNPALDGITHEDQITFLQKRIEIGIECQLICTYLERASGRLHDAVLTKFLDNVSAGILSRNDLSTNATVTEAQKIDFSRTVDTVSEYYNSDEYNNGRKHASRTAIRDIIAPQCTACGTFQRYISIPLLSNTSPYKISLSFLAFLILKVFKFSYVLIFVLTDLLTC